ncbi:MAG: molybdopterin dinucleotide binding domain-containing protein [Gemmatimonadaceae bacterium]
MADKQDLEGRINRPLRVTALIGSRKGDAERGPMVTMHPDDARSRLLTDGELAWVYGPTRHELATVRIDPGARIGDVVLRDITGARPSEIVRVVKPDLDTRGRRPTALG